MSTFGKAIDEVQSGPAGGYLYKYCSAETAVRIFESGGVLLNSVKNFNDPFEGRTQPVWPADDVLCELIKASNPPDKWEELCRTALHRKQKYPDKMPPDVMGLINQAGVSCFSGIRDNLLMWGHYADRHQGVCLGFRYRAVLRDTIDRFLETEVACSMSKVIYSDEFPKWEVATANRGQSSLITKARCWEHEQEWRIATRDAAGIILPIPKSAFSHVIFGAKSSPDDQGRVFNAIVAGSYDIHHMAFQKARIAEREYKLEFDKWAPEELPSSGVINPFSDKED